MSKDKRQWPPRLVVKELANGQFVARLPLGEAGEGTYISREEHLHLLQRKDAAIAKLREALKKCADPWCSEFPKEVADKALKETEGV